MALRDLAISVLRNEAFQEKLKALVIDSARTELSNTWGLPSESAKQHEWSYLLFVASLLAKMDDDGPDGAACRDAALRIAQYCLVRRTPDIPAPAQQASAANILDSLANFPAIRLAINRRMLPEKVEALLPLPLRVDWLRRSHDNSVSLDGDRTIRVNHFQRRVWTLLADHEWISFSAPTSAGKSFLLGQWILDRVSKHPESTIVYLVPTRALIAQVENDIRDLAREHEPLNLSVSSLPLIRADTGSAEILVFTQERLHILMNANPRTKIDVLIVDEAHKIADGHRGVLLQQVVEQVCRVSPEVTVIFSSPMSDNPEILIADAPAKQKTASFVSNEITVVQNAMWAVQAPRKPREWKLYLALEDGQVELGTLNLAATPDRVSKRLSYVAHAFGDTKTGNVVYANGAAEAQKTALQLYGLRGQESDCSNHPEVASLIDLVRRTIHNDFQLATVLKRGIAFHYGNLPLLIRTETERLFKTSVVPYLVCTSTLLEGVNMSCRTMFVRGPTKGRGHPMSTEDLGNLAGRAGRWGTEFQGSIVCVDATNANVWKLGPPRLRQRYSIKRTTDTVVSQVEDLVAFATAGTPRSEAQKRPDLEFVFAYLVGEHLRSGSIRELPWINRLDGIAVRRVEEAITTAANLTTIPLNILERNPGTSPLAMGNLLKTFAKAENDPVKLLPAHPGSEDAVDVYKSIFECIATELNASLGPAGKRTHSLAILVTHWMRGYPINRLISERIRYQQDHGGVSDLQALIRSILDDVEQVARFEAPRSLSCYMDVLRLYLASIKQLALLDDCPDIGMMLEFGVSQGTQISLIGLGLSRTSVVMLGELITADNLDEAGAMDWLKEGLWKNASLPELVIREVERCLAGAAAA